MPVDVDQEDVLAEERLGRPGLHLGHVDAGLASSWSAPTSVPARSVAVKPKQKLVLSSPVGGAPCRASTMKRVTLPRFVGDLAGHHLGAGDLGRAPGADRRRRAVVGHGLRGSRAVAQRRDRGHPWQAALDEFPALPERLGMGVQHLHLGHRHAGPGHQVLANGDDRLARDLQRGLVDEQIEGEADAALSRFSMGRRPTVAASVSMAVTTAGMLASGR
jgi:hypothetical protein